MATKYNIPPRAKHGHILWVRSGCKCDLCAEYRMVQYKKVKEAYNKREIPRDPGKHKQGSWKRAGIRLKGGDFTYANFEYVYQEQQGKCAVCGDVINITGRVKGAYVDHDHKTGEFRGLLCCHCNYGLGHFRDDVRRLSNAMLYLGDPAAALKNVLGSGESK